MTMKMLRLAAATVLAVVSGGNVTASAQSAVNADAALLADFTARVKAYTDLRGKLDSTTPRLTETGDPAKIQVAMEALAARIRAARAEARQGDVFSPDIGRKFRALLNPIVKGKEGAAVKNSILDEAPKVQLTVNASYPKEQPLSTVPPNVLEALPKLSDDLEYRFVGKHLILRDSRANLIVDFIYDAIP